MLNLRHVASNPALGTPQARAHRSGPAPRPAYDVTTGHRRNPSTSSQASNQSAPPPVIEQLMASISAAPKGSKMAEDAAKALRMAERAKLHSPTPIRPTNLPERQLGGRDAPRPPRPMPPVPSSPDTEGFGAIGAAFLADRPATEDPFEYDSYNQEITDITDFYNEQTSYGSETSDSAAGDTPLPWTSREGSYGLREGSDDVMLDGSVAGNVATSLLRNRSQMVRPKANAFTHVAPTQNALAIFWRGSTPQTFALITLGTGLHGADDAYPIEVAGKHTQVVEMPPQWSGRVQRVTGVESDPATRCEIQFGGYRGLTFFGVSYAYGNNGPAVIRSSPSSEEAGSPFRAVDVAPPAISAHDASGHRVVVGTQNVTNQRRLIVHKFYRDFFDHAEQGAILANDESGIVATRDRHLLIDFYY